MKAIILDRDGVINQDSDDFIRSPDDWEPIKGSLEALGKLTSAGYAIFVITNQSGVSRNLFTIGTLTRIHHKMIDAAKHHGGQIAAVLYCPHGPDDGCECRKPKAGLFNELAERLNQTLEGVPAVGDSVRDLQAARDGGAQPILVKTGNGRKSLKALTKDAALADLATTPVFKNLADYVDHLLSEH